MEMEPWEREESLDELKAAWREGRTAETAGPRVLDPRAMSVVEAGAARLSSAETSAVTIVLSEAVTWFGPAERGAQTSESSVTDPDLVLADA